MEVDDDDRQAVKAQVLDLILQSMGDGVVYAGANGRLEFWNAAAEELLDMDPAREVSPDAWPSHFGLFEPDGVTLFAADELALVRALRGETVDDQLQLLRNERTPRGRWLRVTGRPVRSSDGSLAGGVMVLRDVTIEYGRTALRRELRGQLRRELKETRESERVLQQQLEQAQKMEAIGQLAGGIAHDFNNLLTVITSYASLLRPRVGATEREDLDEITEATRRATDMTRQLLAFGRKQVMRPRVVEVNELVRSSERMLRRLIGENIQWETLLEPAAWKVEVDPVQIEQVLLNLAVNARDAMPQGGRLTLETRNVVLDESYAADHPGVRPGPHVMLAMTDSGAGMDAETRARIFEPFFTTKEKGVGTGLGLATVYGIVKQSGGCIYVYSEPERGTVFELYFPRAAADEVPAEPVQARARRASRGETVLVVEDDRDVREVAARVLREAGYRAFPFADGQQALASCEAQQLAPDVLLTDVVMPKIGGRDLARQLAERYPELRVLYTSGYTDDAIVLHGLLDPGLQFVQKPFSPDALLDAIAGALAEPPAH